ncbi:MAG: sensor histidine kinase [Candidatus Obscuribacter sp.]|nr:sensor histidine kinase [Candidatus Obscuribacter sp.]
MNKATGDNSNLLKKIRLTELTVAGVCLLGQIIAMITIRPSDGIGNPPAIELGLLAAFSLLSILLLLTFKRDVRNRDVDFYWLLFQVLAAGTASMFGIFRVSGILILTAGAKAFLALDKARATKIVIISVILLMGSAVSHFCLVTAPPPGMLHSGTATPLSSKPDTLISLVVETIADTAVAIMFAYLLLSERSARLKAEDLSDQLEEMAKAVERNRIAREIHDLLGHRLVSLGIQLELAAKLFDRDRGKALESIILAKEITDKSVADIRKTVSGLVDQNFDFDKELQALIAQIDSGESLATEIEIAQTAAGRLTGKRAREAFRIIQESLSNARKHSGASLVKLTVQLEKNNFRITIYDNGRGFAPEQVNDGFGLQSMAERAATMGASLKVESRPQYGTEIILEFPA